MCQTWKSRWQESMIWNNRTRLSLNGQMDRSEANTGGDNKDQVVTQTLWLRGDQGSLRAPARLETTAIPRQKKHKIETFSLPPPFSKPRHDSPSIFLPFLFNLSSDMFHGASKVAVKAAGRKQVTEGLAGYFEGIMAVWGGVFLDASNSHAPAVVSIVPTLSFFLTRIDIDTPQRLIRG